MNDRERELRDLRDLRFRQRIDQLIDRVEERDLIIEHLKRVVRQRGNRIYELIRQRDMWRLRARVWRPVRSKVKR